MFCGAQQCFQSWFQAFLWSQGADILLKFHWSASISCLLLRAHTHATAAQPLFSTKEGRSCCKSYVPRRTGGLTGRWNECEWVLDKWESWPEVTTGGRRTISHKRKETKGEKEEAYNMIHSCQSVSTWREKPPCWCWAHLIHLFGLCHICIICRQVCITCSVGHGQLVVIAFTHTGSMCSTHHSLSAV